MLDQSRGGFTRTYGLLLICVGGSVMYASLSAIGTYFETGVISWGRYARRVTGEEALLFHGMMVLAGAWLAAGGLKRALHGEVERT